ncbi:MAG: type III restriction-modification system endonuclease [Paludibacter sp.]|nr:type III restriction-modification system endonuclease [Paludibacter sp.]
MELILQTGLIHQQKAVDAIANVFENTEVNQPNQYYTNPNIAVENTLFDNIKQIQKENELHSSFRTISNTEKALHLDIKMETGTGKTYVYTHAIYELHRRYGINKFIVAVPTLPIKAGAEQFLGDSYVQKHFENTCGYGAQIDLYTLKAQAKKKGKTFFPSAVRAFVEGSNQTSNKIFVLLTNMQLLTNATMLSRSDYDFGVHGFYRPFDALAATQPFVIIDEPHRFQRDQKAFEKIIEELKPQCIIRFGATFPDITIGKGKNKVAKKDYLNLLYDLNACASFNQNLIKGVAKEHFEPLSSKEEKIKITAIESKASVTFNHITAAGRKSYTMQQGDSLSVMSEELRGLTISGIGSNYVEFSNGQEKHVGEEFTVDIFSDSYQEQMIRLAIQRHFETERANFNRPCKIKTLALFFIDNIESYRGDSNGDKWLHSIFEQLLNERIEYELQQSCSDEYRAYLEESKADISACHAGYFAKDNTDSDESIADEVDEILHNKKKLLSIVNEDSSLNTRRFLFSKWTLKEGWDNPNVFTIVKLRSSGSDNSKIQEVGRGLRLPVDEFGNRISNEEFLLNYIVDFTEADFANRLVAEINAELPAEQVSHISEQEMIRVANLQDKDPNQLMGELLSKGFVDFSRKINISKMDDFYQEYPEFNVTRLTSNKVIDKNKNQRNTVKVRAAQFDELKELWAAINKKYVIFFDKDVDSSIANDLQSLLQDGVFGLQEITTDRQTIRAGKDNVEAVGDAGVTYQIRGRKLPYSMFLKQINKKTSIPITIIHNAIVQYAKSDTNFNSALINDSSLSRFISKFNDWKYDNLKGRFNYKQTTYTPTSTKLTNVDGTLKEDVVQGEIGINLLKGEPSAKYLYDVVAYDSDLERKNITENIQDVVVFGKIPRKSISIPTIGNDSYSPDFMYVVNKKDGQKELNIVIETKDIGSESVLRGEEAMKISCAESFFNQLTLDGYKVSFKKQLNNVGVKSIIEEICKIGIE